jgi:hypothetical protein
MTTRISAIASSLWSFVPEISRDKVASAAQAALSQLPWVAGTAAVVALKVYAPNIIPSLLLPGLIAPYVIVMGVIYSSLSQDKKTAVIIQTIKTTLIALTLLQLGLSAQYLYNAATLLKDLSAMPASLPLFIELGKCIQAYYFGYFMFRLALFTKDQYDAITDEFIAKIKPIFSDYCEGNLAKVWAQLDANKWTDWIATLQPRLSIEPVEHLLIYLEENPDKVEKAVELYPAIFDASDLSQKITGHPYFNILIDRLDEPPIHHPAQIAARKTMSNYLLKMFTSPMSTENIDAMKVWLDQNPAYSAESMGLLHQMLQKTTLVTETYFNTSYDIGEKEAFVFANNTLTVPLKTQLIGKQKELSKAYQSIVPLRPRLEELQRTYAQAYLKEKVNQDPLDKVFDAFGFTVADYQLLSALAPQASESSTRAKVVHALNDRGVYCAFDLQSEKIVISQRKEDLIQRLQAFLKKEPLLAQGLKEFPVHSKVQQFTAAFFNVTLTAATLAVQVAAAPAVTSAGFVYGFVLRQYGINRLRSLRFSQTSLFYPASLAQKCSQTADRIFNMLLTLNTTTIWGKYYAFKAGVNQGETVRDYISQRMWR